MLTSKEYENLITKNDKFVEDTLISLGLVKKYIIDHNLIVVGGMAIDLSLRLKGSKLYNDDVLPDYDFYSPNHHHDAYKIAEILLKAGMKNITVINANHTTTMRVRVNYTVVADVTYIPSSIFKTLPTLDYREMRIIHPHYQFIDQHRALSLPFENSPWEVIAHRWVKDAKRHDLLYKYYPISSTNTSLELSDPIKISSILFHGQCLGGFTALLYWHHKATKLGFKGDTNLSFGTADIDGTGMVVKLPKDSHGITIYSNNIKDLLKKIKDSVSIKKTKYYDRYLDKLPHKIILNNTYEIFDNAGIMRSAKKLENGIYVANLQNVMVYMLTNWFYLNQMKNLGRGDSFLMGYTAARNIVNWATKNSKLKQGFLPSADTYGESDISDSYINAKRIFLEKIKEREKKQLQPDNIFPDTFVNGKIPKKYYKFKPNNIIFKIDGSETNNYVNRIYV